LPATRRTFQKNAAHLVRDEEGRAGFKENALVYPYQAGRRGPVVVFGKLITRRESEKKNTTVIFLCAHYDGQPVGLQVPGKKCRQKTIEAKKIWKTNGKGPSGR